MLGESVAPGSPGAAVPGREAIPELVDGRFIRERLRIGRSTLEHLERTGRIRGVRLSKRCVRYHSADFLRLLSAAVV